MSSTKRRYSSLQTDTGADEEHHPEPLPEIAGTLVRLGTDTTRCAVVASALRSNPPNSGTS